MSFRAPTARNLRRLAVLAAAGPVTGPLALEAASNARQRDWAGCALYAVAIPFAWALLAMTARAWTS